MNISKILYLWGRGNEARIAQIKDAMDLCITNLLDNEGKDSASGSSGDVSFSFSSNSMSYEEWLQVLSDTIVMLENEDLFLNSQTISVNRVVVDFR